MITVCKCLLIEQTFTKWTSSLSLILGSHRFDYLPDDPVHLPVDFASTQISSILESKTMARRDKLWSSAPFVEDLHVFRSTLLQSPSPSRDNQVRWHVETNYGYLPLLWKTSMSFDRDYYSLLCHPEISESVGTQRQIMVICPLFEDFHVFRSRLLQSPLPSRDKRVRWYAVTIIVIRFIVFKTIAVSFAI